MLLALLLQTAQAADLTVCLQPLGEHDAGLLTTAERGVRWLYGFDVHTLPARPLPESAWYTPRQRHRADAILDWLDADVLPGSGCSMVVGFTARDISTSKPPHEDWGVFGLGNLGGTAAVASTRRLAGWPKATAGHDLVARRTVKVVNHEVGHVLGLPHNLQPGCLMEDAHGTITTVDGENGLLCADSVNWVEHRLGLTLPLHDTVDWVAILGG